MINGRLTDNQQTNKRETVIYTGLVVLGAGSDVVIAIVIVIVCCCHCLLFVVCWWW